MSEQKQVKKIPMDDNKSKKTEVKPADIEKAEKLKDDMDKLLDAIDEVLEENSEKFVKSYVQKGGE